jgi:hypothetical protein
VLPPTSSTFSPIRRFQPPLPTLLFSAPLPPTPTSFRFASSNTPPDTPSSRPVLQFNRLLHPTPLLSQVLQRLSPRHAQPKRPLPCHAQPLVCIPIPATRGLSFTLRIAPFPPYCTSSGIRPPHRVIGLTPHRRGSRLPQHPPDGHPSCCQGHQARRPSTALRRCRYPDPVSDPNPYL